MGSSTSALELQSTFELRFEPLFEGGFAHVFPCDAYGRVHMDALNARVRDDYLYARVVVGIVLSAPKVKPCIGC